MRRDDQVRRDRCDHRRRLLRQHVERGAAQPPALQRREHGADVDDRAARRVDEQRARPHRFDRPSADQTARLAGQRNVQRDRVAFGEQLVELDEAHTVACDGDDVVRPDLRPEREQPRRDGAADPPVADDPDAQPGERPQRPRALCVPAARGDLTGERHDAAQQRVEERERVIGDLLGAVVGHAPDGDPARVRRLDVHVVVPDAGRRDDPQCRQPPDQLGAHRRARSGQDRDDVVRRRRHDVETRERLRREALSHDEDLHCSTRERNRCVRSSLGAEKNSSGGASSTIRPSSIISTELAT